MSDIPISSESLNNILSRLPVKSLLQFRSVSKHWRRLIDSRTFVNLHLNQPLKTLKILTLYKDLRTRLNYFYSINVDSSPRLVKLEPPFDGSRPFNHLVGSGNGLVCLVREAFPHKILFWNPSTRKFKMIQKAFQCPPSFRIRFICYKFGYDHVNDDHKVVVLLHHRNADLTSVSFEVTVYSMKRNEWQSVPRVGYHICRLLGHGVYFGGPRSHGVCVNGVIHWVAAQNRAPNMNYSIVALHLAGLSFELVPQPEYNENYEAIDLGILDGCLCVVGNYGRSCVDIWVMGKYGVKESWKKLVAMTLSDITDNVRPSVRPITFMKNGKEVFLEVENRWFMQYDLENKETKPLKFHHVSSLHSYVYQESLVKV
ncbi:F-box domain-containing protein [Artemisia annua]|uniref:F-box domain-containing protein n=1 Tax=Artemisia annua TaxID=35608 RepID=A0A2U1L6Y6_ARTAN|nr:F-box domain-containing protein [Artemisia annua]